ncbi:MAG TPA: DUF1287 domain-containing protein [Thermoanaerobaculia bacterium]|nr:DUF1287 domain-containing protein [Thermoanaerobaculia bacterium]
MRTSLLALLVLLAPAALAAPTRVQSTIARAAEAQVGVTLYYDFTYVQLRYPGGDVPRDRGVCTDVVVRAFRAAGVDLQYEVHRDMTAAFAQYPKAWGLRAPDPNIDHRRVPNLITFFKRRGKAVRDDDFQPGDVVAWRLPQGRYHVGVISRGVTASGTPLVVHNIGYGARKEDVLHAFDIIGHYRW